MWSPCVESGAESPGCSGLDRRKPPRSIPGEGVGGGLGGGVGGGLGGGVGGLRLSFAGVPAEVSFWASRPGAPRLGTPGVGFLFLGGIAICRITITIQLH